jgi:hypothetical protein
VFYVLSCSALGHTSASRDNIPQSPPWPLVELPQVRPERRLGLVLRAVTQARLVHAHVPRLTRHGRRRLNGRQTRAVLHTRSWTFSFLSVEDCRTSSRRYSCPLCYIIRLLSLSLHPQHSPEACSAWLRATERSSLLQHHVPRSLGLSPDTEDLLRVPSRV